MKAIRVVLLLGIWVIGGTGSASAQEARAMTLAQVERLFGAGVNPAQILATAREACIDFRIDTTTEGQLTRAGATADFIASLRTVCFRGPVAPPETQRAAQPVTPPPAAMPRYNPGSAMTRSLIVPGLGQFYTGRPVLGVLFLAAWGGAIGAAVLSQETTVECLARVTDVCPAADIRGESVSRPLLVIGAGGALAIAVISAFEAKAAAGRLNRASGGDDAGGEVLSGWATLLGARPDGGVTLGLRLRTR